VPLAKHRSKRAGRRPESRDRTSTLTGSLRAPNDLLFVVISEGAGLVISEGAGLVISEGAGLVISEGAGLVISEGAGLVKWRLAVGESVCAGYPPSGARPNARARSPTKDQPGYPDEASLGERGAPRVGGRCSQRGSPPPDSLTDEAVAGAGDRRTELHHRMTPPNADSIDAVVAPERHLHVDPLGWARRVIATEWSLCHRRRTVPGVEFCRADGTE
jgi:hypothetical protein